MYHSHTNLPFVLFCFVAVACLQRDNYVSKSCYQNLQGGEWLQRGPQFSNIRDNVKCAIELKMKLDELELQQRGQIDGQESTSRGYWSINQLST